MKKRPVRISRLFRYPYPKLSNWLRFQRERDGSCTVTDHLNKCSYTFSAPMAWFARRLDGRTDPHSLSSHLSEREIVTFLCELDKYGLLRRSRILDASSGRLLLTLLIPKRSRGARIFHAVYTRVLELSFLPVFLLGWFLFIKRLPDVSPVFPVADVIIGLLLGAALHELSHAFACLAYGGEVFESGIHLGFPNFGAYVLIEMGMIEDPLKRVGIDAAGVEMNLLLAGVALLLSVLPGRYSGDLFNLALVNTELGLMNLLLIRGLDGAGIMSELLGIDLPGERMRLSDLVRRRPRMSLTNAMVSAVRHSSALIQSTNVVLILLNGWVIVSCFL